MLQNTKKVFKIQLRSGGRITSPETAQISASGASCGDALPDTAYVITQVSGTITGGDIVYSNSGATTLFDGGGSKYLLSLDSGINVHSVTISTEGEVTYIELCEESCVHLVSINGTYTGDTEADPTTTVVEYIACGDATNSPIYDELSIGGGETLTLNTCIKEGSLYIGGVQITNESPTGIPFWSVTVDFSICL